MILTNLSNTTKQLWEKISFHKHFNDIAKYGLKFQIIIYIMTRIYTI